MHHVRGLRCRTGIPRGLEKPEADGERSKMLRQGGCSDQDESDVYLPVYEVAWETLHANNKDYSLALTLSGVYPITMPLGMDV